jgi:hypothetical protein
MILSPHYATEEAIKIFRAALVEGSGIEVDDSCLDGNGQTKKGFIPGQNASLEPVSEGRRTALGGFATVGFQARSG